MQTTTEKKSNNYRVQISGILVMSVVRESRSHHVASTGKDFELQHWLVCPDELWSLRWSVTFQNPVTNQLLNVSSEPVNDSKTEDEEEAVSNEWRWRCLVLLGPLWLADWLKVFPMTLSLKAAFLSYTRSLGPVTDESMK